MRNQGVNENLKLSRQHFQKYKPYKMVIYKIYKS